MFREWDRLRIPDLLVVARPPGQYQGGVAEVTPFLVSRPLPPPPTEGGAGIFLHIYCKLEWTGQLLKKKLLILYLSTSSPPTKKNKNTKVNSCFYLKMDIYMNHCIVLFQNIKQFSELRLVVLSWQICPRKITIFWTSLGFAVLATLSRQRCPQNITSF
jgi:hypothetical protein